MLHVLWWLLAVEAIGLAAFPIAYFLLPGLRDRGYSVSKALGLLLIGYGSWILSLLHILPSVRLSLVALLLAMAALSGWYAWRRRQKLWEFLVRERRTLLAAEAIFLVFFVGWVIYRAYDPAIDHTEKPMDFALLNASMQSRFGAPEDPWLSGEPVSYYYFGYWMLGALSKLSGVPSNVSYNLSLALIPALGAMGMFGLVYSMVGAEPARRRYAVMAAVGAAVLLGVVANLEGVLEFMRANGMGSQGFWRWMRIDGLEGPSTTPAQSWMPQDFWWWFRATRVINTFSGGQGVDYTIEEFPFFSFMLGDLHPHVMSIPFVILFLTLAWNFLRAPVASLVRPGVRPGVESYLSVLALGLALGGIAFTNMWDLPTFSALFLGMAALKTYQARGPGLWTLIKGVAPIGAAVIGLAFLLYLPYHIGFSSSVTGIYPVTAATTRPVHMLIVWALFLVAVTPFIFGTLNETIVKKGWPWLAAFSLAIAFAPYLVWAFLHLQNGGTTGDLTGRLAHILPFAFLISLAVYSAMWHARAGGPNGKVFALALSALGLLLIMGPELLFVGDFFRSRMNTMFKLYYQAWILLAAASGFALYYWGSLRASLSGWRRSLTTLWAAAFVVLLAGSLYYAPAAAASKGEPFSGDATLDGLAYLAQSRVAEYEAIRFVKREVAAGSTIVEAVGEWFEAGLISRSTGVPAVLNWPGHQLQWRGSQAKFDGREQDVARIYQTLDVQEAKTLLARHSVEYVYVGPRERGKYGAEGLDKFPSFMEAVFSQDDVVLYRLRPQPAIP